MLCLIVILLIYLFTLYYIYINKIKNNYWLYKEFVLKMFSKSKFNFKK